MNDRRCQANRASSSKQGFALIASLAIMAVLVMIAVALYSMSNVATRTAKLTSARTEAQANAKMALMIALGDLQKYTGPDKRITARALTMAKHPELETSVARESAKAWWLGVASSDASELLDTARPVVWLVSGLKNEASAEAQIDDPSPFQERAVPMFGEKSIDTSRTGGETISAGAVPILGKADQKSGAYAFFVDDEGMKAQLVAENRDLRNDDASSERPGGSIVPGNYNLGILDGMDAFDGVAIDEFHKVRSLDEMPLIGGPTDIAANKRLDYTIQSTGVLSDVKEGRLKRDLTIAFENFTTSSVTRAEGTYNDYPDFPVFNEAFAKTNDSNWDNFLVIDDSKHDDPDFDFGANGYIHWAMLRDFYNTKRYIRRNSSGRDYLELITIHRDSFNSGNSGPKPNLGPHEYGADTFTFSFAENLPYGDFDTMPTPSVSNPLDKDFLEYYKHSPITPVLARLQYNSWLEEIINAGDPADPDDDVTTLQTNTQVWASHYNPYNISLQISGDWASQQSGPRLAEMPQAQFRIPDSIQFSNPPGNNDHFSATANTGFSTISSFMGRRAVHLQQIAVLPPGRAMLAAYDRDSAAGTGMESDRGGYGSDVANLVTQSVFRNFEVANPPLPNVEWHVDIYSVSDFFTHGVDNFASGDDNHFEWAQIIWSPIAFEPVTATRRGPYSNGFIHAGKRIPIDEATYNQNATASFIMWLQSTTDGSSDSLRPLVDANIRAMFFNPRWDSPLDLDMVAPYRWELSDAGYVFPQMRKPNEHNDGTNYSYTYWGSAHDPSGWDRVVLFDIPREDLVSLGQLQHANLGRFNYEPTYVVGNSYANPRIPLEEAKVTINDTFATTAKGFTAAQNAGTFDLYDASYLVNEVLWDSYVFTTIPHVNDNYQDPSDPDPLPDPVEDDALFSQLKNREVSLPNPRYLPYEPSGSTFDRDTLQAVGDGAPPGGFDYNAGHLLVDGAFNVNSTSVDAWEAFLSGTHGMPYQKLDDNGQVDGFEMPNNERVRFPRVQSVFGDPFESSSPDENYWTGYRALEQTEVRELAEAIVNQIIERGPFLTLGAFINRKLQDDALGEKGALQAALDEVINSPRLSGYDSAATNSNLPANSNQAAGFPGQLLQGDILQALAPMMAVRSDTFTIRAYGDSVSPDGNEVISRAWCEAVVQRYPDPASPDPNNSYLQELTEPSNPLGRQFRIVSFRWLNENEI